MLGTMKAERTRIGMLAQAEQSLQGRWRGRRRSSRLRQAPYSLDEYFERAIPFYHFCRELHAAARPLREERGRTAQDH